VATGFEVRIENTGESFRCGEGQNVLNAMEQLRRKGIPVGCRNGGCGVCKVRVTGGRYTAQKMSRACVTAEEEAQGMALACRIFPESDLEVDVVGKMLNAVTAGRRNGFVLYSDVTPRNHNAGEED
jgi:ferredoxin